MDISLLNLINSGINGLSAGLLLFMLSAGLTLIFSLMGVLNFAHASFYMLGAYLGWALSGRIGFWLALGVAPVLVGALGALFERFFLRRVQKHGHVPELLITFGLSYVVLEGVQLIWGRAAVPFAPPAQLLGSAFTLVQSQASGLSWVMGAAPAELCRSTAEVLVNCSRFPLTRAFMMAAALLMLLALALIARTRIGLIVQAALTHPQMVEALGHDVPRVRMAVFGFGCALAALAGVIGGITFVTEPSMAAVVGPIIFVVVVVGGMGSLVGAFFGSLLIGLLQTLPLVLHPALAQAAPLLPYLLLVLMLIVRPRGLLGTRET